MERKLAAILSTDVKGYSRLMGEDDEATIRTLTAYREVMTTLIREHHGRVVDSPGDNLLAEFGSAVNAVEGAIAIQGALKTHNAELPANRKMEYRIGVNLGDVMADDGRLYGDGVNIAARLESLADAGGICISGKVFDEVKTKVQVGYDYLGEQSVKNIANPVPAYKVQLEQTIDGTSAENRESAAPSHALGKEAGRRWPWAVGLLVELVVVGAVTMLWRNEPVTEPSAPREESSSPEATDPALSLPDKPSIAVLPFTNMSGEPEQEHFTDGITEDVIADLVQLPGLFVIARNTAFTYKGQAVNIPDVGQELGVRYVLEGSVRKAGDRVRITAQLIDATTGGHVWAERYDRELKDIFALQDEITQRVVAALRGELTQAELERIRYIPTENLNAYDSYLRGLEHESHFTQEEHSQARQMFERAIALDPQFADAYSWLAGNYWYEFWFGWSPDPKEALDYAFERAQQALALDDAQIIAHHVVGTIYSLRRQYEEAIAALKQAIALSPNDADGYYCLGAVLSVAGRSEESIGLVDQAIRLNPRYPSSYVFALGQAYHLTGQAEKALAAYKRILARTPNHLGAQIYLVILLSELDRKAEAQAAAVEVLRINPNFSVETAKKTLFSAFKDQAVVGGWTAALRNAGLE